MVEKKSECTEFPKPPSNINPPLQFKDGKVLTPDGKPIDTPNKFVNYQGMSDKTPSIPNRSAKLGNALKSV